MKIAFIIQPTRTLQMLDCDLRKHHWQSPLPLPSAYLQPNPVVGNYQGNMRRSDAVREIKMFAARLVNDPKT